MLETGNFGKKYSHVLIYIHTYTYILYTAIDKTNAAPAMQATTIINITFLSYYQKHEQAAH